MEQYSIFPAEFLKTTEITSTQKVVLAAIISFWRGKDSLIFPSYNRIASISGISRRTAIRAVAGLIGAGILQKEHRTNINHGGNTSNLYILPSVNSDTTPSVNSDTTPSVNSDTTPSVNSDTPNNSILNNNIFYKKNKKKYAREAQNVGSAQREPEQTDIEDFTQTNGDTELYSDLQGLGKGTEWLQLLRSNNKYFLRFIGAGNKHISKEKVSEFQSFIKNKTGFCEVLQNGQYLSNEIIITEKKEV